MVIEGLRAASTVAKEFWLGVVVQKGVIRCFPSKAVVIAAALSIT